MIKQPNTQATTMGAQEQGRRPDEPTRLKIIDILKRRGVTRASIIGSVARGNARETSDLDVLAELPEGSSLLDLIALETELRETLNVEVDVVTFRSLHPLLRDEVLSEQIALL